jgi:predicted transcriptional regulator
MQTIGERQALTVRVPADVHEALKTLAMATNRRVNDIVLIAVRDYLAGEGHREAVDAFLHEAGENYKVALDKLADL